MKTEIINKEFVSNNIKRMRKAKRMTQLELARKLGVCIGSVKARENNVSLPNLKNIITLCNCFNIRLDDFIGFDYNRKFKFVWYN